MEENKPRLYIYTVSNRLADELAYTFFRYKTKVLLTNVTEDTTDFVTTMQERGFHDYAGIAEKNLEDSEFLRKSASVDIDSIFSECRKQLREIGVPIAGDDAMDLVIRRLDGSREAECFTVLFPDGKRKYILSVKAYCTKGRYPDLEHLRSNLMHELVHTCPEDSCRNGHGEAFMKYADEIWAALGIDILDNEDLISFRHGNMPVIACLPCRGCRHREIFRTEKAVEKNVLEYGFDKPGTEKPKCQYCGSEMYFVRMKQ